MSTIDKQIKEWEHKLLLASNPTEIAVAKKELRRLKLLKKAMEKEKRQQSDENDSLPELYAAGKQNAVFVIHGHDDSMKRDVQLFVSRCGLDDIVGHEEADLGRTIIEKLEEAAATTGYALALLSPDDVQADGTMRARQNVIFEIGYFMGRLGRNRVRILRQQKTVIPTDLKGLLYTNYDDNGAWRLKVAKEMKAAGLDIDMSNIAEKF